MSEFGEVMKQWRRMCIAYGDNYDKCKKCPLGKGRMCSFEISDIQDDEIERAESTILAWAEAHPEPVYPTWYAWLANMGVVPVELPPDQAVMITDIGLLKKIPADIAKKLGIEPKEDT